MWPLIGIKMAGCNLLCAREAWWTSANVPHYNHVQTRGLYSGAPLDSEIERKVVELEPQLFCLP